MSTEEAKQAWDDAAKAVSDAFTEAGFQATEEVQELQKKYYEAGQTWHEKYIKDQESK
jgi:hypothetical protein|tara:strand:- start:130 stop:303 length:174 start_codon:yes stop_codon:yes gene_type:complete